MNNVVDDRCGTKKLHIKSRSSFSNLLAKQTAAGASAPTNQGQFSPSSKVLQCCSRVGLNLVLHAELPAQVDASTRLQRLFPRSAAKYCDSLRATPVIAALNGQTAAPPRSGDKPVMCIAGILLLSLLLISEPLLKY